VNKLQQPIEVYFGYIPGGYISNIREDEFKKLNPNESVPYQFELNTSKRLIVKIGNYAKFYFTLAVNKAKDKIGFTETASGITVGVPYVEGKAELDIDEALLNKVA
ncbi:MAG: hypothetical protein ACYC2U_08665, partial [Candidatus Amoebophilus sp.]